MQWFLATNLYDSSIAKITDTRQHNTCDQSDFLQVFHLGQEKSGNARESQGHLYDQVANSTCTVGQGRCFIFDRN